MTETDAETAREIDTGTGVLLRSGGAVAELVLDRPAKRNALSFEMWQAIPELVSHVEADRAVSVLVVRGAGEHFSAGADIAEFETRRTDPSDVERYGETVERAERALLGMCKPSIAAISGYALGGGCELALACDLRVAASDAKLGITASRLGVVYTFLSTHRLVTAVGAAYAKYMLMTGAHVPAAEALRVRLVDRVVEPAELDGAVAALAAEIDSRSQVSVRGARAMIEKIVAGATVPDAEAAELPARAARSDDYREGVRAFLAKRAPRFTDR